MTQFLWILAQATQGTLPGTPAGGAGGGAPPAASNPMNFFIAITLAMVFILWWSSRNQSKERKKVQDMLANLKRSDRVQTIGGMIGTVVDVRDNEVVLKVDETNNVKIRFTRGAIKEVLQDAPRVEAKDETKDKSGKK